MPADQALYGHGFLQPRGKMRKGCAGDAAAIGAAGVAVSGLKKPYCAFRSLEFEGRAAMRVKSFLVAALWGFFSVWALVFALALVSCSMHPQGA